MWKAYFKRGLTSCEGVLTIQKSENGQVVEKPINQILTRSGHPDFFNREWVRAKSPCPRGLFRLWLTPTNKGIAAGQTGIGEFYPMSSDDSRFNINENECGPMPVGATIRRRSQIGLHEENKWRGSAGCLVVVKHTDWIKIRDLLRELGKTQPSIDILVF